MKKRMVAVALLGLSLPVMAQAAEFQPIGTLGMGGAGVARNNGALASYWNPAGGAFSDSPFAMNVGVGVGARGSDGFTKNIDRLSDVDFEKIKNFDAATADAKSVGEMIKAITILDDMEKRKGNVALSGNVPLGFAMKRFSFGLYGNFEGNILPKVDTKNLIPVNATAGATNTVSITDLSNAVGTQPAASGYFTPSQLSTLTNQLGSNLANAIDNQMNESGIPADTTFSALTTTFIPVLTSGGTNTLDKNNSSAVTKAIGYIEVPLSYGYPIDFGNKGKLGIGATAKIISGQVYQNQILLVNRPGGDEISSGDLQKELTKNSKSSVNFGIDLGALYKYDTWLSVGVVAKNLNSPKFAAPDYNVPEYDPVTKTVISTKMVPGEDVKLKPQVRAGVALDPLSWLTIVSDLDLTENETVAPGTALGSSVKSRNLGGGLELHPYSWLRIRGGAYKNLADSDVGMVLTTGFTLFMLDVDGAFATDTFKLGSSTLPKEFKVQVAMSFAF